MVPGSCSPSNSVFSAGQFAATGEALAKSLFLGGVLHRFPALRVALLEGGVASAARLYKDFTFTNAARFYGGRCARFLAGPAVESAALAVTGSGGLA